ncbi:MAG: tRNA (adenosine(37)-N6)-dimethylallyltransferase MiaA [Alphaproteobacteria bacterium]|jgi:tRNA dimethylallyltransferase|nr:tRNA (adenosine(37)-N6)-dimethylallyltransferase MiaA [Alphaproteobacteria bacterium]
MKNKQRKIVVFCGATASGKSSLAMAYALENNGVIINFDSQQVYKDLRVLNARPSEEDEKIVEHRLYGFLTGKDAFKNFSVTDWCELAKEECEKCFSEGKIPVLVGGTGFYLQAFMEGLSPVPELPGKKREAVYKRLDELSNEELFDKLKMNDPILADKLEVADRYRVCRALEVFEICGKPLSYYQSLLKISVMDDVEFEVNFIFRERKVLHDRIKDRFHQMLKLGAMDEVKTLSSMDGFILDKGVSRSIGVSEFYLFSNGKISWKEAVERSIQATKKYAKRQNTWFKRQVQNLPDNAKLNVLK